ncbi:MAG: penicillin-binding protein activator [Pseudobdellovibrio sp.]
MIKKLTLISFAYLSSCASPPVQFYPARRSSIPPASVQKPIPAKILPAHLLPTPTSSAVATTELVNTEKNSTISQTIAPTLTPTLPTTTPPPLVVVPDAVAQQPKEVIVARLAPAPIEQQDLMSLVKNPHVQKSKVLEAISRETSLSTLDKILEQPTSDIQIQFYRPNLYFKAGQISQKNRRLDLAMQYYRALTSQFPQNPQTAKAAAEIALLQAAQIVDSKVIGAILPLTGKNSNIGQHALNSIRLGLGLNKPNPNFRLAIFDSQSSAELAIEGVEKLVRDDKAIAIIGGLSSKEALAAAQKADLLSVPFIGLSQKAGLTNVGDYVFRNSVTAEMQVDRLVQYAFEKLNAKRFAVLYPNDAYGVEFANIYWDHVLARGGQITAAQTYNPKENDFTSAIQKILGTFYVEARQEEYNARVKEIELEKKEKFEKNKDKKVKVKNSRTHETLDNILPALVDFDVLFIPDTGKTLGQVMAFMKVNDVLQMTYLGTNIWNSPDLVKRAGQQNNSIFFIDAIDMNDSSIHNTPFFKDYLAEFNEEPSLIEMQVFESAKILRDLIASGASSREAVASRLRILGRVSGVTGELHMTNYRELERPLHIMSLETGLIKKVD